MEQNTQINELVDKLVNNKLTHVEYQELDDWVTASEENMNYFLDITDKHPWPHDEAIKKKFFEKTGINLSSKNNDMNSDTAKTNNLNFGAAFEQVKKGKGMRLPQWSPDVVIRAQYPNIDTKMTAPYLYVESRLGKVPWKETMIELFAENWEVID